MLQHTQAIILAAGKSRRFNTNKTKMTENICGQPMILYQTKLLEALNIPLTVVIGHQKELLQTIISTQHPNITFVVQKNQSGTGDALRHTAHLWNNEHILVMNGDIPLITADIVRMLYHQHTAKNASISFVTAHHNNPHNSYGRVIEHDNKIRIVEAKHLNDAAEHCCINAGIYLFKKELLEKYINNLTCNPVTQEYYLTDLIEQASQQNEKIETVNVPFDYVRGVNTLEELWAAEQIKRSELIRYWMNQGVRFSVAQNVHIDLNVQIGAGTYISSGVQLTGNTSIGNNCTIHPFSLVHNSTLHDEVIIHSHSVIHDSVIQNQAQVGPFAHIRKQTTLLPNAVIGSFVEVKNSTIGTGSKARHLTYLGDTTLGQNVNIGAGTITANFDGKRKHKTVIKDNVQIGANNSLVAPITVGKEAYTAAGSTLTENVPAHALALGRARQVNKKDYMRNRDQQKQKKKTGRAKKDAQSPFVAATKITHPILPSAE